jgi:hypothetical protein
MNTPSFRRSATSLCLALGYFAALHVAAGAQPAQPAGARRLVNGHTVDLSPLLRWSAHHDGDRPLSAWVHVSGNVTGTNAWGWVISGQAEKSKEAGESAAESAGGSHQFVLKNPPVSDMAEFERLHAEMTALNAERNRINTLAKDAKTEASLVSKTHARHRGRAASALRRVEQADENDIKTLDQKIDDLKKKMGAISTGERYQLNGFALDTGTTYQRLPVYDYGMVLK